MPPITGVSDALDRTVNQLLVARHSRLIELDYEELERPCRLRFGRERRDTHRLLNGRGVSTPRNCECARERITFTPTIKDGSMSGTKQLREREGTDGGKGEC